MGYCSTIDEIPRIKTDKIEQFKAKIKEIIKAEKDEDGDLIDYWLDEEYTIFTIEEDGNFDFNDWNCKHYGDEQFAKLIKDYCEEGVLIFTGEDGEKWGYYFDGEGKCFELIFSHKQGGELFRGEEQ